MTPESLTDSPLLLGLIGLATVLACLLLVTLVLLRVSSGRAHASRDARAVAVRDLLLSALVGEPDESAGARAALVRRHGRAWALVEEQAFGMLPKIKGDSRAALVQVLDDKGAAARAVAKTSSSWWVARCQGAHELGSLGSRDAVPVLLPMLDDVSHGVRRVAVRALGAIGDPAAVTPLLQVAGEEPRLTNDLVLALDRMGPGAAPALRAELERSVDQRGGGGRQAELAAAGLGLVGDVAGVDLLVRALTTGRPPLQVAAAQALGRIGDPRALPALARALDLEDEPVKLAAVQALGGLASEEATAVLARWLESGHHELGRGAAASLARLPSGRDVLRGSGSVFAREALATSAPGA